jgi:AAA+ superfamily predicted ATPase
MNQSDGEDWIQLNQQYLLCAMAVVRKQLEIYEAQLRDNPDSLEEKQADLQAANLQWKNIASKLKTPSALETLVNLFGLSAFERSIILLCAGVELDSSMAALIAGIQNNPGSFLPTYSLALSAIPDAHWSSLSPNAPLRYWRLVEMIPNQLLSKTPIKIDEQILHYLAGVHHPDTRLEGIVEPVFSNTELVPSHLALASRILQEFTDRSQDEPVPIVLLSGENKPDKESIGAWLCREMGLYPYTLNLFAIPSSTRDIQDLTRLWNREAALKSYALLLDYSELDFTDKSKMQSVNSFIENVRSFQIIFCSQNTPRHNRKQKLFEVSKPTSQEQLILWQENLGDHLNANGIELNRIVSQFNFSARTINQASRDLLNQQPPSTNGNHCEFPVGAFWKTCCVHARPDIGELAHRIDPIAKMDDLVLPESQKEIIRELIIQVKNRSKVYTEWGFAQRNNRGLGITALFAGESGTGKTMASEVLANELKLDLYRIDLSQVVNKYIGETEKNLKKIFDAAEEGGAILLFDEADALFGKRSEVKDSHDRYANVEISYLLQRMEVYRGLAILTTNMKNVMDKAWMRRIRFIVQFPFPDLLQRADIWKRIFPSETPTQDLDMEKLARLNIAGGNIRNIALNAAFIAASENRPVGMMHIRRALRTEYEKIEKPLTNMEMSMLK